MKSINTNGDRQIEIYTYLSRRGLMKLLFMSTLGMGLWINACDDSTARSAPTTKLEKEGKMETLKSNSTINSRIPPIDDALPAKIETATFALG